LARGDWLGEQGVTHVAMEATGVYWKPVWHVLEESFELAGGRLSSLTRFLTWCIKTRSVKG